MVFFFFFFLNDSTGCWHTVDTGSVVEGAVVSADRPSLFGQTVHNSSCCTLRAGLQPQEALMLDAKRACAALFMFFECPYRRHLRLWSAARCVDFSLAGLLLLFLSCVLFVIS